MYIIIIIVQRCLHFIFLMQILHKHSTDVKYVLVTFSLMNFQRLIVAVTLGLGSFGEKMKVSKNIKHYLRICHLQ